MFKALFEVLTKYIGVKTVSVVGLMFLGGFIWFWVNGNFVTTKAHADDLGSITKTIHREAKDIRLGVLIGDAAQQLDTLQLRKELTQQRVWEQEDKLEETGKEKWRNRLETSSKDLGLIQERIEELSDELKKAAMEKHSTENGSTTTNP